MTDGRNGGIPLLTGTNEWIYRYQGDERVGLIEITAEKTRTIPEQQAHNTQRNWTFDPDDVWLYGDPMGTATYPKGKPKSYADALVGSQWQVMRIVTRKEFYRTLYKWQELLHQRNGDIDLLHEVLKYDIEAKRNGISNVQEYIASRIDRTRQAVSLYQQMIDMNAIQDELATNYLHNDENSAFIIDGSQSTWQPSKRTVERKISTIPRDCAAGYDGCKGNTQNGKLALCYPCHVKVVNEGQGMPEWLLSEMTRIRRDHYHQAVNACYEDYYGTMSLDEAETYLDAA